MSLADKIDLKRYSCVLVAPLDWGLGHATRCIPLIKFFLENNIKVHIAGNGNSLALLRQEFPELKFSELPGYNIRYSKHSAVLGLKLMLQSPGILRAIKKEHQATKNLIDEFGFDLILSDNRYGCYSTRVHSIFLGHQLKLKLPRPLGWINNFNKKLINRFDECWVPDYANDPNLSGELSHNINGIKAKFIGPLSRFHSTKNTPPKFKYLAIISGPEPQRSKFYETLLPRLLHLNTPSVIALGNPSENQVKDLGSVQVYSHLGSEQLNKLINESEHIICRSGYSSIMDMVAMEKRTFIVPTPGQTEQEYLADYLDGRLGFSKINQKELEHFEFLN